MLDRTVNLSHISFMNNNIQLVKNTLKSNYYPNYFVDKYVNKRWDLISFKNYNHPTSITQSNNSSNLNNF